MGATIPRFRDVPWCSQGLSPESIRFTTIMTCVTLANKAQNVFIFDANTVLCADMVDRRCFWTVCLAVIFHALDK